ncbi:MAG: ATP-dependent RecD-like DNA helicase [Lachnospiraceae bacterium]|nr:ATP-dependent RecD-like DNA helicase [Lachnospiraceae bacterium]
MSASLKITAYIDHFIYRNAENGYGVADLIFTGNGDRPEDPVCSDLLQDDSFTAVGTLRGCDEGDTIEAVGDIVVHAVYGPQFRIESFRVLTPADAVAMERYLASGAIKGIGEKMAHRIVRAFGDDTFRIMEEEPERLAELKGISERMAREIGARMKEKHDQRELSLFLQQYGIGGQLAVRVVKRYGESTRRILQENPYRLAEEIEGVGFRTADEIAQRMGIHPDAEFRVSSGILYALTQGAAEGHSYLPFETLFDRTAELLRLPGDPETRELMDSRLRNLTVRHKTVIKGNCVYAERFFYEEQAIAGMLRELDFREEKPIVSEADIDEVERELEVSLDEKQREAVKESLSGGVMILTGGPGTGKTTTMGAILRLLEKKRRSFVLAAPTGRAAKRMTEATGFEARTIHRLLEVASAGKDETDGDGTGMRRAWFNRNEDNPLEADAVIIDEMSMVDMHLFHALLKACVRGVHLILIGDAAQLPSVGAGQILRDLIDSGRFPVIALTQIFRQAAQSDIVTGAHQIHAGIVPAMDNKSRDFFFLPRDRADTIIAHLILLIRDKLPGYVNASPGDIQVLVPMRRGPLGAETLNRVLQQALNPPDGSRAEWEQGDRIWRVGDKVMQTRNDYSAVWEIRGKNGIVIDHGEGIFNGDLGTIVSIDRVSQEIVVQFDENRLVCVPFSGMEDMDLAYAMTIHKSQGSEYPAVLLPLLGGPRLLLNRNLLYTAVTRARSCVVVLGSRETVEEMVANEDEMKRYTGLKERILECP